MPQLAPLPAPRSPSSSNCASFASLPTPSTPLSPSQPHPSLVWPELNPGAAPPPFVAPPFVAPRAIGLAVQRRLASQRRLRASRRGSRAGAPLRDLVRARSLSSAAATTCRRSAAARRPGSEGGALAADDYDSGPTGVMTDARGGRAAPEPPTRGVHAVVAARR